MNWSSLTQKFCSITNTAHQLTQQNKGTLSLCSTTFTTTWITDAFENIFERTATQASEMRVGRK